MSNRTFSDFSLDKNSVQYGRGILEVYDEDPLRLVDTDTLDQLSDILYENEEKRLSVEEIDLKQRGWGKRPFNSTYCIQITGPFQYRNVYRTKLGKIEQLGFRVRFAWFCGNLFYYHTTGGGNGRGLINETRWEVLPGSVRFLYSRFRTPKYPFQLGYLRQKFLR